MTLKGGIEIMYPEDARFDVCTEYSDGEKKYCIFENSSSKSSAGSVFITNKNRVETYPITVGTHFVTSFNKDDILGDGGKAMFDPATNTLTLNNPIIDGFSNESKIYSSSDNLTIKGSYHMDKLDDYNQLYGVKLGIEDDRRDLCLTLDGNFTFYGDDCGIYDESYGQGVLILKGSNKANTYKFVGCNATISGASTVVEGNPQKVELIATLTDSKILQSGSFSAPTMSITSPGGVIYQSDNFYESNGKDFAKQVVLEPKPFEAYPLWIADTQVTSDNWYDVLGDGTAKYDHEKNVLSLNNPTISGAHTFGSNNTALVYSELENLTVEGNYHLTEATAQYAIATGGQDVALQGAFTLLGTKAGVRSKTLKLENGCTDITLQGGEKAADATNVVTGNWIAINTPNVILKGGLFYGSDGATLAQSVSLKGASYAFDLWLGDTQVHELNYADIFGDGKASFDPATNTLTLNNPTITGSHEGAVIWSDLKSLTINGSYHQSEASTSYAVYGTRMSFGGDFTFRGIQYGLYVSNITVNSGTVKAVGGVYGINVNRLIVKPDATKLEMEGGSAALKTSYKVIFEGLQGISLPENGEQSGIFIRDGSNPAKKAIVEPGYKRFNIWVGSTQVVGHNGFDILGDGGKAKFDLMTNTLTLNEPTITGNHAVNGTTATICSIETPLNVKGTYHMTEANAELGIYTFDSSLSIDGDITCFGTLGGAYSGV